MLWEIIGLVLNHWGGRSAGRLFVTFHEFVYVPLSMWHLRCIYTKETRDSYEIKERSLEGSLHQINHTKMYSIFHSNLRGRTCVSTHLVDQSRVWACIGLLILAFGTFKRWSNRRYAKLWHHRLHTKIKLWHHRFSSYETFLCVLLQPCKRPAVHRH